MPEAATGAGQPEKMHLFLDTNTYLGFFKLSGDDLEELEKLVVAVRSRRTVLYLTRQLCDEFRRSRAKVIHDSLKSVEDTRIPSGFPRVITNLEGFAELRAALAEADKLRRGLVEAARQQASDRTLQADKLIEELFRLGTNLPETPEILAAATFRHSVGNPPGKKDSLGDAINWESLLAGVPDGQDLVIVTADADYVSALDVSALDDFLVDEWEDAKGSSVKLYPGLTALLKAAYPHIKLAADLEKEFAINSLVGSGKFRSTHTAISKLRNFAEFTPDQVRALAAGAISNSQVSQILADDDVRDFYSSLLDRYGEHLGADVVNWIRDHMKDSGLAWWETPEETEE